ncbi:MAG: hypothetical protein K9G67_13205 [Bacteroidales bacterium]|nr:hypothetical protein [Bacteroidales bacterium]MCF8344747.1 hypothetical protein [Bacteroidales bacterium]MCF8352104.1 hypothetical protein [Bacteroidales bacterium]MCF8377308.1 hypothetical protein [Bacteroidales bacterium]
MIKKILISVFALSLLFMLYSCDQKNKPDDLKGIWESTKSTYQGKDLNFEKKEILHFRMDSTMVKKIRFGDQMRTHKGIWFLSEDGNFVTLSFDGAKKSDDVKVRENGVRWEILELTEDMLYMQASPNKDGVMLHVWYQKKGI